MKTSATIEEQAGLLQDRLNYLGRSWAARGDTIALPVDHLNTLVNSAGGIRKGGRPTASVPQLQLALEEMQRLIQEHGGLNGLR